MSRSTSFRASLAAAVLAVAAPAAAQAGAGAPPPSSASQLVLGIEIRVAPAELDAGAVREAITSDLGVQLTDVTAQRPALGVIVVTLDRSAAHVVYRRDGADTIERTLALPSVPNERVQLIAFLVTNLVRDQASEALAQLARPGAVPTVDVRAVLATPPAHAQLATIGLVPPLQVDRLFAPRSVVGFGVYGVMGMQDGTRYASVSGAVDYQRQFASGVQIGGAAAYSPVVAGAQIAGAVSISRQHEGLQLAGAASISSRVRGLQLAGAATVADEVTGVQVAGAANVAGDVHGMQLGAVNIATRMHGLQLGIINISDGNDDAIPIGLINFARHGRTAVEASADSSEMTSLTLRHGPRYVHNVWGFAYIGGYDEVMAGVGIGTHADIAAIGIDVDAMSWNPIEDNGGLTMLNQLRATVAVPVGPVDIVGGAIGNVYVEDGASILKELHPHLETTYTSGATRVVIWPSAFLGVRLRT